MANAAEPTCRLCLVTPPDYDPAAFAPRLADALAGGDVASLIVTAPHSDVAALERAAAMLVPIARARDVATLVHGDVGSAQRTGADGVHIDTGASALRAARDALRGGSIVGAGGLASRHDALDAGEAQPDYVFFGRLDGDDRDGVFPKSLELAAWWASVAVIPAIVMGGRSLASVDEAAAEGIEFVALASAVWDHPKGPAAAVAAANARLATVREAAA